MKISLIQPARNNLKYLQWSYESIRKNQGDHVVEICVADDFSSDGLAEWCRITAEDDENFKWIQNHGPKRLGHTILYDKLINEVASHDICMIFHADMYLAPHSLDEIECHLKEKTIVSLTRVEPPWWPNSPEKLIVDFGSEPEAFDSDKFLAWLKDDHWPNVKDKTTNGIFAPWAFYKKDFQEIGGHDPIYAPQSKEDSDIFNRFKLNGLKFIQTWRGCVYHLCCRGSRFNPSLTNPGQDSGEWKKQNKKSERNFIRKWGSNVRHNEYLDPIIIPKYKTHFLVKNCSEAFLRELEPYCSTISVDCDFDSYISDEQPRTPFPLKDKISKLSIFDNLNSKEGLVVQVDCMKINEEAMFALKNLNEIVLNKNISGQVSTNSLHINFNNTTSTEKSLIKI